jgi:hypothetical protein
MKVYCCYGMYAEVGHSNDCPTKRKEADAMTTPQGVEALRKAIIDEMSGHARDHDKWPNWPGTRAFAEAALRALGHFVAAAPAPPTPSELHELSKGWMRGYSAPPVLADPLAAVPAQPEPVARSIWAHDFDGSSETFHDRREPFGEDSEWTQFVAVAAHPSPPTGAEPRYINTPDAVIEAAYQRLDLSAVPHAFRPSIAFEAGWRACSDIAALAATPPAPPQVGQPAAQTLAQRGWVPCLNCHLDGATGKITHCYGCPNDRAVFRPPEAAGQVPQPLSQAPELAAECKRRAYEMSAQDVAAGSYAGLGPSRATLDSAKVTAKAFESAIDRLAALAAPAQALQPLSDEQIDALSRVWIEGAPVWEEAANNFARAIEAAHGIGTPDSTSGASE